MSALVVARRGVAVRADNQRQVTGGGRGARIVTNAGSAVVSEHRGGAVRAVDRRSGVQRIVQFGPNLQAQLPASLDGGGF